MNIAAKSQFALPTRLPIHDAAALAACRRLVAFPTETVYGLGADATNGRAVADIFAAKGRPRFNPLIVHVRDLDAGEALRAVQSQSARKLASAFWPGALTLVLPRTIRTARCRTGQRRAGYGGAARAGTSGRAHSCWRRRRAHRGAERQCIRPISATTAAHVAQELGR